MVGPLASGKGAIRARRIKVLLTDVLCMLGRRLLAVNAAVISAAVTWETVDTSSAAGQHAPPDPPPPLAASPAPVDVMHHDASPSPPPPSSADTKLPCLVSAAATLCGPASDVPWWQSAQLCVWRDAGVEQVGALRV